MNDEEYIEMYRKQGIKMRFEGNDCKGSESGRHHMALHRDYIEKKNYWFCERCGLKRLGE